MYVIKLLHYYHCKFSGAIGKAVNGLLVIQAFRPDRLTDMARVFVEKVLGSNFAHAADKELNLANIVETEVRLGKCNVKIAVLMAKNSYCDTRSICCNYPEVKTKCLYHFIM